MFIGPQFRKKGTPRHDAGDEARYGRVLEAVSGGMTIDVAFVAMPQQFRMSVNEGGAGGGGGSWRRSAMISRWTLEADRLRPHGDRIHVRRPEDVHEAVVGVGEVQSPPDTDLLEVNDEFRDQK
jgi:hypothetical protein